MEVDDTSCSIQTMNHQNPVVSIIIANYNGESFIRDALASCARQTITDIEIIVIDDASTDRSIELLTLAAQQDDRITLLRTPTQIGPGGARNYGLEIAKGNWIAVLDSDDIMHPQRLSKLVSFAEEMNVEIVSDNQLVFDNIKSTSARSLLARDTLLNGGIVSIEDYIASNQLSAKSVPLGYLKPLIRRSFLDHDNYRYDSTLRIGEDYDLMVRLLLGGARLRVHPDMTYFYRRHTKSISHRLSIETLLPMLVADDMVRADTRVQVDPIFRHAREALDRRRRTIEDAIDFEYLVEALKARRWKSIFRICRTKPRAVILLRIPLRDRLKKLWPKKLLPAVPPSLQPRISLLSRQRIVGATNGSSAYLISLCAAIRNAGYDIDLISPSPAMFGRLPLLHLDQSMNVFSSIRVRGSLRLGQFIIATDPRIAGRAIVGLLHRLLARLPTGRDFHDRKAPHAIAVPLTDADQIFIANSTRESIIILTDYVFLNEATPFALQPTTLSAVIMHDLFFTQYSTRALIPIDCSTEMKLLDLADAVIPIQVEEGQLVKQYLPKKQIVLTPMSVSRVSKAQVGGDGCLLFVGSNTLPNLDGIRWFLSEIWPQLIQLYPKIQLKIAGTCCRSLTNVPANVILLGRIEDLTQVYRQAGIVISPLRLGSGLKIKLVEAFGHGKACIVTYTTLQGVRDLAEGVVMQADDVSGFIEAIGLLLYNPAARLRLAELALNVAHERFSSMACYHQLLTFIRGADLVKQQSLLSDKRLTDPELVEEF